MKNFIKKFFEYEKICQVRTVSYSSRKKVSAMKDNLTAYERRENIKALLIKKRFSTAQELSFMYGVSQRTIFRDIVFLSSRLPITTKPGGGGGIFLNSDFESPKQYLNAEEENLLLRLSETLCKKEKLIINNIVNKFSVHRGK